MHINALKGFHIALFFSSEVDVTIYVKEKTIVKTVRGSVSIFNI